MTTNSSRKFGKDISQYDAWQQLRIFQHQRWLNTASEERIIKDSSDDRASLIMPMQPASEDTDEMPLPPLVTVSNVDPDDEVISNKQLKSGKKYWPTKINSILKRCLKIELGI